VTEREAATGNWSFVQKGDASYRFSDSSVSYLAPNTPFVSILSPKLDAFAAL